jgi:hypothetical protein
MLGDMTRIVAIAALVMAVGCGDVPPATSATQGGAAAAGVQISGTIAEGITDTDKLLVFVYARHGERSGAGGEPTSLSNVAPDRSFLLSSVPPGDASILFLIDAKADGVIDPGDSVATLDDPERALLGLQPGDEVILNEVTIRAAQGKATAASITVKRATAPPGGTASSDVPHQ